VAVVGVVLGLTQPRSPSPPRWRLTESYSGAQIAQRWKQFTPGGPYCNTPGTFSVQGRALDLRVSGVYGNCTRFTSTFTAGFGKTAVRMYIPHDVVADRAAWPAFWGYPESRVWPTAGEIDVYEQLHAGRHARRITGVSHPVGGAPGRIAWRSRLGGTPSLSCGRVMR